MFPYHLSDVLVKGLHVTPFSYYLDIMVEMLKTDKSYDSLPNFSAIDGTLVSCDHMHTHNSYIHTCRAVAAWGGAQ